MAKRSSKYATMLLDALERQEKKDRFYNSLPMDKKIFFGLFLFLAKVMVDKECDHTLKLTKSYLRKKSVRNIREVTAWLREHGGYCDCEVLINVAKCFE